MVHVAMEGNYISKYDTYIATTVALTFSQNQ